MNERKIMAEIAEDIGCQACGEVVGGLDWTEHARTHNPSAYREGWPCRCRPKAPCPKHVDAAWFR